MNNYAPIVIFTYKRKIGNLIKSILRNKEASKSDLFIFSDGYKNLSEKLFISKVRDELKTIKGFKSIKIYTSDENRGLAKSIINGVTKIAKKFEKFIVLEDDLIVAPYFLNFMNRALKFYELDNNIWSISGYSPLLPCLKNYKYEVYHSLRSSSWGWATWSNRWNKIDWTMQDFLNFKNDNLKKFRFNMGGNDLFKMLELQHLGKIDSWAIVWCYNQFINSTYSIFPKISMTKNIGFNDKMSTHNKSRNDKWNVELASKKISNLKAPIDAKILSQFKKFHDLNNLTKVKFFFKKWML